MASRSDIPHYTPDDVERNLRASLALTAALDVPEVLAPAVFRRASEMLGAKTVQLVQPQQVPLTHELLRGLGQ